MELDGEASLKRRTEGEFTLEKQGEHLLAADAGSHGGQGRGNAQGGARDQGEGPCGRRRGIRHPAQAGRHEAGFCRRRRQNRLTTQLPETGRIREVKVQVQLGASGSGPERGRRAGFLSLRLHRATGAYHHSQPGAHGSGATRRDCPRRSGTAGRSRWPRRKRMPRSASRRSCRIRKPMAVLVCGRRIPMLPCR